MFERVRRAGSGVTAAEVRSAPVGGAALPSGPPSRGRQWNGRQLKVSSRERVTRRPAGGRRCQSSPVPGIGHCMSRSAPRPEDKWSPACSPFLQLNPVWRVTFASGSYHRTFEHCLHWKYCTDVGETIVLRSQHGTVSYQLQGTGPRDQICQWRHKTPVCGAWAGLWLSVRPAGVDGAGLPAGPGSKPAAQGRGRRAAPPPWCQPLGTALATAGTALGPPEGPLIHLSRNPRPVCRAAAPEATASGQLAPAL